MECDTAVVGGGPSGLYAALRAARRGTVVLLEAGPGLGTPPDTRLTEGYAFPEDFYYRLEDRDSGRIVRQGRGLGGGSTVNIAAALRGGPASYDAWSVPGWEWERVLPAFRAIENDREFGAEEYHGSDGAISIVRKDPSQFDEYFFESCSRLAAVQIPDHNAPGAIGFGMWPTNRIGKARCGGANAVAPLVLNAGGEIRTGCRANRLLFERDRCVGVEFVGPSGLVELRAAETIVCAGAYGSPKLLCYSGVGPEATLKDLGLAPVSVLEGVGSHLQDHPRCVLEAELRDPTLLGDSAVNGGLYRFLLDADRQDEGQVFAVGARALDASASRRGVRFTAAIMAPRSAGRVTHNSSGIELHQGLVTDSRDRVDLASVVRTADCIIGGLESIGAVTVPSGAWWRKGDQHELIRACTERAITYSHACGTCRMGTDPDAGDVVSPSLRVFGVQGLRVADCSVMPRIPQANTNLPSMMIGYRGGDMESS